MRTNLSATQSLIVGQVEHILNELRDGITTNPEEDGLSIFNQEQTMSLKALRGKG